jgi:FkbM family methyltransferase
MNAFKTATVKLLSYILPDSVKNSLFHMSFHLAPAEFEKFAYDHLFAPHMGLGLAAVASRGFSPKTIVDVGAFEGNWSKLVKRIWPASRLVMVEPNLAKKTLLLEIAKQLDAQLYCELLGAQNNLAVPFYVMESGSSVLSERSAVSRVVETRQLRTLGSLLETVETPGLLKVDAQGYELQILQGAMEVMPKFEGVLLEIALIEVNEGAPLLHDVVAFMKGLGFLAYDILELHRRPLDKALNQIDILFVSEHSKLIADKRHFV